MRKLKQSKQIQRPTKVKYNMNEVLNHVTDNNIREAHTKLSLFILGVSIVVVGVAICL